MKLNYVEGLPSNYTNLMDVADEFGLNRADLRLSMSNETYARFLEERGHGDLARVVKKFDRGENGTLRNTYGIPTDTWNYYKRYRRLKPIETSVTARSFTVSDEMYEKIKGFRDAVNKNSKKNITFKDIVEVALNEYLQRRLR